jgi:hypothetical protein
MIISLKTKNKKLNDLFEPPIIGGIIIFLISILPVPLMFIINGFFDIIPTEIIERYNAIITAGWNIFLTYYSKIKISIFFIPCWILFLVIGLLRLFQVIS